VARNRDVAPAIVVAAIVGSLAFAAYTQTLLRTVDLGDTGGFQAAVTSPDLSARQAYPLYLALGRGFVAAVSPDNPALGLNLLSAVFGACAVAALGMVSVLVTGSAAAGGVAALLLASSYTWWHQANIAEVYTLHLLLVGLCLLALWWFAERQSNVRLATFFLIYAAAFGNHLSMVLLLAPFALFLFLVSVPRTFLLRPAVFVMAAAIAAGGALQYLPDVLALKNAVGAPRGAWPTLAAFWFDVTKADWRATMLLGVPESELGDRLAMALFDARQQFGIFGLLLAVAGVIRLWRERPAWAALCISAYVINTVFAITYNVGDPHVFFLPGHYITAFCAGAAFCNLRPSEKGRRLPDGDGGFPQEGTEVFRTERPSEKGRRLPGGDGGFSQEGTEVFRTEGRRSLWREATATLAIVAIGYTGWRAYDTWPAVDRRDDVRAQVLVNHLTHDVDERRAVLAVDLDWQIENALLYSTRVDRRNVAWVRLHDVLPHLPFFVDANHAAQRDVVLSARAAAAVESAFGPLFTLAPSYAPLTLAAAMTVIPPDATYVFAVLAPPRDQPLDTAMVNGVLGALTGDSRTALQGATYEVIAGRAGKPPTMVRTSRRPFRTKAVIGDAAIDIRMDGWLPSETFRRGGFGHVVRGHKHAMTLERGANLIWFGADGQPSRPYYACGLYEPQPLFRIPANAPGLALIR
jgi:hypothetical protein